MSTHCHKNLLLPFFKTFLLTPAQIPYTVLERKALSVIAIVSDWLFFPLLFTLFPLPFTFYLLPSFLPPPYPTLPPPYTTLLYRYLDSFTFPLPLLPCAVPPLALSPLPPLPPFTNPHSLPLLTTPCST